MPKVGVHARMLMKGGSIPATPAETHDGSWDRPTSSLLDLVRVRLPAELALHSVSLPLLSAARAPLARRSLFPFCSRVPQHGRTRNPNRSSADRVEEI